MNAPIRTRDLTKTFRRTLALSGLTFEVPEGSIYGLVGPNGAGKTTALKVLMNIHRPTSGTSEVLGVDSRRLAPAEFAQIGYVSENQEMPEWMTVQYYLDYLANFYAAWDRTLAANLLRQLHLPPDRKLRHLSRGMKMKAALASSLAYRPRLIVLDEPFTGLDALVRDELIEGLLGAPKAPPSSSPPTTWPRSRASPATSAISTKGACSSPRSWNRSARASAKSS
jgi:ABC-2 type transport system ATP-binding protein